ncbi:hypothetical protein EMPS_04498 [Entomortierella parvispora]|uniref:Uncharacterized protein n=1 Tax=Entomortierella parvispora TaxID=205924 RepID=A0A9P3H8K9_9FUNG|nr:hypothetical protein EMPS_04498 [Entomortierella parvispora]
MTQKFPESNHDQDVAPTLQPRSLFLVPLDQEADEAPVYLAVPLAVIEHPVVVIANNEHNQVPDAHDDGQEGGQH